MGKKPFGGRIDPKCEYCAWGSRAADGKRVLCNKRGIMEPLGKCRRFSYDPLKRIPPRPVKLDTAGLREEDFQI